MSVSPGVMRIGEVHAQLRKDFPEVELSKIRYYEDKGLVEPSRSRKGYRLYSERDVACLREAIRLAQEEFVPLRVVRLRLIEQGLLSDHGHAPSTRRAARETNVSVVSAPAPTPATRPALSVVPDLPDVGDAAVVAESVAPVKEYFNAGEVLAATGVTPEEFNHLQALGLVSPLIVDAETVFGAHDVRVAAHARALLTRGVDARVLGSLRRVAEREIGVIEDLTAPLRVGGVEASEARAVTLDVAREVAALRALLVERELARYLGD